ncbi:hypothetical protein [Ammoniphilus sp. YIM 78166]|uniref:hypothetical protein n=1 Tax=Ammoniphilus sp. YIM 78166 TaxID=1644106 RepID=UPI0010705C23|nr:hypothetical protein [Ammoniphilus sp. YIM 78166]
MIQRRPISFILLSLALLMIPLAFLISYYLFFATAVLLICQFKIPTKTTKCPRCKKDNTIESWTVRYLCASCETSLYKEKSGWSRIHEKRGQS